MSCSSSIHIREKIAGYNFPFIIPRNQFCDFEEVLFNWNFNFQGLWPTKKREIMLFTLIWSHEPIVQSLSMLFNYGWCSIFKIILLSLSISLKRRKLFNMMKANLIGKFSGHAQYIPYLKMVIMIMILIILIIIPIEYLEFMVFKLLYHTTQKILHCKRRDKIKKIKNNFWL